MNILRTMKQNSSNTFQSRRLLSLEQFSISEQSAALRNTIETCKTLVQKPGVHSVIVMKTAGFRYANNEDTVCCDTCGLEVSGWSLDMKPFSIHAERSPACPFVHSIRSAGMVAPPSTIPVTSFDTAERSPEYQNIELSSQSHVLKEINKMKLIRKRGFSHSLHQTSLSSEEMIVAGFFSCNIADRVICLYCNLICQQWAPNIDDPIEVHKTLSPKCPYVIAMLAQQQTTFNRSINETVDRVADYTTHSEVPAQSIIDRTKWFPHRAYAKQLCTKELYRKLEELKRKPQECHKVDSKKLPSRAVNDRLHLPISTSLVAQGFDVSIIKSCYEDQLQRTGNDFVDDCDLRMACTILQKQIQYIDGKEDNIIVPSVAMNNEF